MLRTSCYQPFFDASSPIHQWFPAREWAVRIPAFILVVGISAIGVFLGLKVACSQPSKDSESRQGNIRKISEIKNIVEVSE